MKTVTIKVSQNGWKYEGHVTLTYQNSYRLEAHWWDMHGKPFLRKNKIILDDTYEICFDEEIEIAGES